MHSMSSNDYRAGFVRFQQGLAREALVRGRLEAARMALQVLQTSDFAGGAAASAKALAVLGDVHSTENELSAAVYELVGLEPAFGH